MGPDSVLNLVRKQAYTAFGVQACHVTDFIPELYGHVNFTFHDIPRDVHQNCVRGGTFLSYILHTLCFIHSLRLTHFLPLWDVYYNETRDRVAQDSSLDSGRPERKTDS